MDQLKQLFSAPAMAALRNLLSAVGGMLALLGFMALSQAQIDKIMALVQQLGVVLGSFAALAGVVAPVVMALIAGSKSTDASNVQRTASIANDPKNVTSEAAVTALVNATSQIGKSGAVRSDEAQQALVTATIDLPSVQTIVAHKHIADAVPSESVVSTADDDASADNDHAADAAAAALARPLGAK